jgi:glutamine synthetase
MGDSGIPSLRKDENANTNIALESLRNLQELKPQVRFVRFQWQDLSGLLRARVATIEYALQLARADANIRLSPIGFHCIADNSCIPWLDLRGMHYLIADWSSLRIINMNPPGPSYATVMCGVVGCSPEQPTPSGSLCPRGALENVICKASEDYGVHFLVGFEVEFEVVKIDASGDVVPQSAGFGRYAIDGLRDPSYQYVEEAVEELLDSGVLIQEIHSEGGVGQYEITLGPLPPLQAVDQLIFVHDTLKRVFNRHGLVATMSPVSIAGEGQGAGQHTHISINPPLREEQFLAGILKRLPGLCAFTLPYDLSYSRVKPSLAGDVVGWGSHHRETAIRKINPGHWEIRCIDATANMYLSLAAILSAGLLGYQTEEPLGWPDMALTRNATRWPKLAPLPQTVDHALDSLHEIFEELESIMESKVVQHYLDIKRWESNRLKSMDHKDLRALFARVF